MYTVRTYPPGSKLPPFDLSSHTAIKVFTFTPEARAYLIGCGLTQPQIELAQNFQQGFEATHFHGGGQPIWMRHDAVKPKSKSKGK